MRNDKKYLPIWIILLVVTILGIASFFVVHYFGFFNEMPWLYAVYVFGLPLLVGLTISFFAIWKNLIATNKIIEAENLYNLGKNNRFFDYNLFAKRVKKIQKSLKNQTAFVLTFTTSHYYMVKNSARNPAVTELNGYIADFLSEYFKNSNKIGIQNVSFCFHHGQFVIFMVGTEEQFRATIEVLETEI